MNKSEAQGSVPELGRSEPRARLSNPDMTQVRVLAAELRRRLQLSGNAVQPVSHLLLLTGPAGSGKTLAAEVLARELGANILRVDLSQVLSHYIGETEKNLSAAFERAAASNSILFFDEADALFGKRSEVKDSHDRYAGTEANFLLQRARKHPGIVILACSARGAIADATDALELHIP